MYQWSKYDAAAHKRTLAVYIFLVAKVGLELMLLKIRPLPSLRIQSVIPGPSFYNNY